MKTGANPTPKKVSRRLLEVLAINGQHEDSVTSLFAQTSADTSDTEWFPPLEFPELPEDEEMIDLGVVGSGKSEVEAIVVDDGRAGSDLKQAVEKLNKADMSKVVEPGVKLHKKAKEEYFPANSMTFAPNSSPAFMQTSCFAVLVSLVISLILV